MFCSSAMKPQVRVYDWCSTDTGMENSAPYWLLVISLTWSNTVNRENTPTTCGSTPATNPTTFCSRMSPFTGVALPTQKIRTLWHRIRCGKLDNNPTGPHVFEGCSTTPYYRNVLGSTLHLYLDKCLLKREGDVAVIWRTTCIIRQRDVTELLKENYEERWIRPTWTHNISFCWVAWSLKFIAMVNLQEGISK